MSQKSTQRTAARAQRASAFRPELQAQIIRQAEERFGGWQARGRTPLWFRIKSAGANRCRIRLAGFRR